MDNSGNHRTQVKTIGITLFAAVFVAPPCYIPPNGYVSSVACRGQVMPGATAWLNAPTKFWYGAVAYGGHCYRINSVCDVTI